MSDGDLVPRPPTDLTPAVARLAQRARHEFAPPKGFTVLVVAAAGDPAEALEDECRRQGHPYEVATSGPDAVARLRAKTFDVILMNPCHRKDWEDVFVEVMAVRGQSVVISVRCECGRAEHQQQIEEVALTVRHRLAERRKREGSPPPPQGGTQATQRPLTTGP